MPVAMALLRDVQNLCPKDVLNFILDLIKYNDNRKNKVKTHIHTLLTLEDLTTYYRGQDIANKQYFSYSLESWTLVVKRHPLAYKNQKT